jgi:hypothetical protein
MMSRITLNLRREASNDGVIISHLHTFPDNPTQDTFSCYTSRPISFAGNSSTTPMVCPSSSLGLGNGREYGDYTLADQKKPMPVVSESGSCSGPGSALPNHNYTSDGTGRTTRPTSLAGRQDGEELSRENVPEQRARLGIQLRTADIESNSWIEAGRDHWM